MTTKVLEKGLVAIPSAIRQKLGLEIGDEIHAEIQNGNVVLVPRSKVKRFSKSRIVVDKELGLPVLTAGEDAPVLTHERVREMLADFS